ncbi:hypothetical protein D9758_015298 [Tetrapyrgos nigripes]|uniref:Cytochrome P450 n=1 Tax=Tetrapyrgos nigripes TaxID=182062 RepID=A0A8H5CQD3_9AGAR|nr:hypothetical protein D9758_015298 [Tetrapyrgos nigripes]
MFNPSSVCVYFASSFILAYYIYHHYQRRIRSKFPLPPGPKGLPLIGSLFKVMRDKSTKPRWRKYLDMGKTHISDIIYINVLGDRTIVLNSAAAVTEILERRSGIYSSRPPAYMLKDLSGRVASSMPLQASNQFDCIKAGTGTLLTWITPMNGVSLWHRLHRKTFHQYFQPRVLPRYHPVQRRLVFEFLNSLVNPSYDGCPAGYVRHYASSIILRVVYGITSQEDRDHYVRLADRAVQGIVHTGNHGSFLVDYFPLLKHIPTWMPGATFKRQAKVWKHSALELRDAPWEKLAASNSIETAIPCFVTENIEKFSSDMHRMQETIKNCAGMAYIAASDTSVSLILTAILHLLHNPDVQSKAQQELDEVIGKARLPDFGDREKLPYIEAIMIEALRIHPVLPLSVPHYSIEDDVYQGYFIPKGTTVIGNAAAVLHDEIVYPEPYKFKPDRWMKQEGKELPPSSLLYGFGYGRRECPGKHFALDTVWLAIAGILSTCNITKAVDKDGQGIEAAIDYVDGMLSHPKPFKCQFSLREFESGAALGALKSSLLCSDVKA